MKKSLLDWGCEGEWQEAEDTAFTGDNERCSACRTATEHTWNQHYRNIRNIRTYARKSCSDQGIHEGARPGLTGQGRGKMIAKHHCLNEVERMYRQGNVSDEEVTEYLRAWNATPGRFTQAVLLDGAIRNFDPEKSGVFYRHLKDRFGLKL